MVQEQEVAYPWAQSTTRPPGSPLPLSSPLLQHLALKRPEPLSLSQQLAGRTVLHLENWAKITDSQWVLDTVAGYKLELEKIPCQTHHPVTVAQRNQEEPIHQEVQTLLDKGAVIEVPPAQADKGFYSTLFLVLKKEGQNRPVVNIRPLNRFVKAEHFKMEGMHIVRNLLQEGDWMTRLDLKDAYFAIPVHKHHQKYLRFRWRNKSYQFQSLPFSLSTAPRTFTKVLRPVIGLLRELGIRCVIYLDDILIMNQDKELARQQTWAAIDLLESLGFLVNYNKSVLDPVQE